VRRPLPILFLACTLALAGACKRGEQQATLDSPPPVTSATAAAQPSRLDRRIVIASSDFEAGSQPGRVQRVPEWESRPERVRLGEYEIDSKPYASEQGQAPLLGATKDQASLRCAERKGRLCTELEWEHACRGPANTLFSSGDAWHKECAEGDGCASGFGVLGMGSSLEWTASSAGENGMVPGDPLVRGAYRPAGDDARCSRRRPLPKLDAPHVAFRCCYGPPNAARVTEPEDGNVFDKINLPPARLKELLAGDPLTKDLATDLKLFSDPEGPNTVLSRGPGDRMGFDFTTAQLVWRPTRGAEFLLVAGKSGKETSFVLAYHVLGKDRYSLASSFILEDEIGPVVFAYSPSIRPRLHFSSCWGCPGETGKLLFRAPDGVAILQP
jgi:hypothetical protein